MIFHQRLWLLSNWIISQLLKHLGRLARNKRGISVSQSISTGLVNSRSAFIGVTGVRCVLSSSFDWKSSSTTFDMEWLYSWNQLVCCSLKLNSSIRWFRANQSFNVNEWSSINRRKIFHERSRWTSTSPLGGDCSREARPQQTSNRALPQLQPQLIQLTEMVQVRSLYSWSSTANRLNWIQLKRREKIQTRMLLA